MLADGCIGTPRLVLIRLAEREVPYHGDIYRIP